MSVTILHLDTCYPSYLKDNTIDELYSVPVDNRTTVEEVYSRLERGITDHGRELCDEITRRIASAPNGGKDPFDPRGERDCNRALEECVHAYFVVRLKS